MALNRKYAGLPDLDSAPDIYETPELTDDNSTVLTSANPTQSDDESDRDELNKATISRSSLRVSEARSRFRPANLDASDVDFSDRVDGKRKSYKASTRRHRILRDGTEELGHPSDDDGGDGDDAESLERRIARLRREVLEAKEDHARLKAEAAAKHHDGDAAPGDEGLESLSRLLEDMSTPLGIRSAQTTAKLPPPPTTGGPDETAAAAAASVDGPTYAVTYAPTYEQSHALAKAADFDRRLLALEAALGVGSSAAPEADHGGLPRAMLPTLDSLEKQISTLSQASTANLDAISRRVRTLASEQEKLNESREKARALRDELDKHAADEPANEAKVKALYAILPAIEGLAPMLPALLDRLRSLRAMHAAAAAAGQALERVEAQQADMAAEMKLWRDGLHQVEGAMRDGDATVKGNVAVMEGWVRDLEERMARLA